MKKAKVGLAAALTSAALIWPQAAGAQEDYGDKAMEHMRYLSEDIGERPAGTESEREAKTYIETTLEDMGYETKTEAFPFTRGGEELESENLSAVKPGKFKKEIIVGAHYDTVADVEGIDDNASGVGVMLETAEHLEDMDVPYTIRFIAFGAEEGGLNGSEEFVENMSNKEKNNTLAMINLDSLAAGDQMYVYGGGGKSGWYRNFAQQLAEDAGIDIQTNPGLNPEYPEGTTGLWSDHAPFQEAGIDIGYFEATNWELGAQDGYTQTAKHGAIWHDPEKDNFDFIESEFPGRMETNISGFSEVLTASLTEMKPETKAHYQQWK